MTAIIFLQNAYSSVYAKREWPRESWLRALENCRSGKMLKNLTDDLTQVHNTTPLVGKTANSKLPPDYRHMGQVIAELEPSAIVACGNQAIEAVRRFYPMDSDNGKPPARLELPHPACRWVKADLYREGRRLLDLMTVGKMNFRARIWEQKGELFKVEVLTA